MLKSVAKHCGEPKIDAVSWHQQLLASMTRSTSGRPPVLSTDLHERLGELLGFRHVSRHATALDLDWEKMEPVAVGVARVAESFLDEMTSFVEGGANEQ
ncbi:MAG: hypothetical protein H6835_17630 [Planctomycetes bacterium]|nr:hypothetical protein [Planctomycetota bacterium]